MRLYIAEKPSVASDITKAIGGNFERGNGCFIGKDDIVTWCVGHVLELADPALYNESYAKWTMADLPLRLWPVKYEFKESTASQAEAIIKLINRDDVHEIVHAGDPDDEGQLLVDEVLEYARNTKPVKRIFINDNTLPAVKKSISAMKDNRLYRGLYLKALARSVGDYIYGLSMTRAYTIRAGENGFRGVLSAGRVQTPVLGLIVFRWRANKDHASSFYYTLSGEFSLERGKFNAAWKVPDHAPFDEKKRLIDKSWGESLAKNLSGKSCVISAAGTQDKNTSAPLPFNLVRLQQHMNKKNGFTAAKTLEITQQLKDKYKAITYNRSDCSYLSDEQFNQAGEVIPLVMSALNLNLDVNSERKSKAFDSAKITAHTAIIPTPSVPSLSCLTSDERAVYVEICHFYLAQFMEKKSYKEASAIIDAGNNETFSVRAKRVVADGFEQLLGSSQDDDASEEIDNSDFQLISGLKIGDKVVCDKVTVSERKTTPPPLFTEATILAALVRVADFCKPEIKKILKDKDKDKKDEHGGIGTPATRAAHVELLKKRNYITVDAKGRLIPTETGIALIDALPEVATTPDLTALWAVKQNEIESGNMTVEQFVQELYQELEGLISTASIDGLPSSSNSHQDNRRERLDVKCPSCNSEIIVSEKRCGCSECKFGIWTTIAGKKLTKLQVESIISKGRSGVIKGFKSRAGKTFNAVLVLKDKSTGQVEFDYAN